jgi:FixJ family two-component response regulator
LQRTFAIAVIDDDDSMREAVAGLVKSLGHRAVAFGRAEDFLQFDQRSAIACLIADVQMPGMTGPDLHNQLVASGELIPTILITAYPDQVVRARALQNGVKCFFTKPFREEELIQCIQSALDTQSAEKANG